MENRFKQKLENFIAGIGKLQTKFGLEGKLMINQSMTSIPLNDGSVRVFPSGFYLGNLTEVEVKVMDLAIMQWVVYASLCIEKNNSAAKELAAQMEVVYNFLSLRYKPLIDSNPNQGFTIKYKPAQSQISVERIHERFNEYLKTLGEGEEDAMSHEQEGKEKEYHENITEQELKAYTSEETDALKKGRELEARLKQTQRKEQRKRQAELDKLKEEVGENYSNENAGKLYELLGDCEGFWQIAKRGIEKRRRDV